MNQETESKRTPGQRISTVVGVALCIILIPILIVNCTLIVKSYLDQDSVPDFGGYLPLIVLTDSMTPMINSGDLILCQTVDAGDVQVGDVISFFDPAGSGTSVVTHKVIEITEKDGALAFCTQGTANNTPDTELVPSKNLVGSYRMRIPGAGNVALFMQSTAGLVVCVVLPLVLLVGYDVIRRRQYDAQKQRDTEALLAELEALRAQQTPKDKPE